MLKPPRWVQPQKNWKPFMRSDDLFRVEFTCGCGQKGQYTVVRKGEQPMWEYMYCCECARQEYKRIRTERKRLYMRQRRGSDKPRDPRPCEQCGEQFAPKQTTGRYCSPRCRVAAHREKK
jgi:hypothetical protein